MLPVFGSFPILILGGQGQVGRALTDLLQGHPALLVWSRADADLSEPEKVVEKIESLLPSQRPQLILNAAAYTQVDQAEKEPEIAEQINAKVPTVLARWCKANNAVFVHYSTDYVFSGEGTRPWRESDPVAPLNAYGKTKLAGEIGIQTEMGKSGRYFIFRTSWVYDEVGKNFLRTMLRLGSERTELKVVADQWGAPTYAPDLARATLEACANAMTREGEGPAFPSGVYHLCGKGETTWYEFAQAIFQAARARGVPLKIERLLPILTTDYPTPARRPANSRMSGAKAAEVLGVELLPWMKALENCMERIR